MKTRIIGYFIIILGVVIFLFSKPIVFPGLERLIGIERIVGKHSVIYLEDGEYCYTNPGAMMRWIGMVALTGLLITTSGIIILVKQKKK